VANKKKSEKIEKIVESQKSPAETAAQQNNENENGNVPEKGRKSTRFPRKHDVSLSFLMAGFTGDHI